MNLDFRSREAIDGAQQYAQAQERPHCVCAECKYAQIFAVQPRALCQKPGSVLNGRVLFAGQPACAAFVPQRGVDVRLSAYTVLAAPDHIPFDTHRTLQHAA